MSQEQSLVYVIAVTVKIRNYCAELYSWIVARCMAMGEHTLDAISNII